MALKKNNSVNNGGVKRTATENTNAATSNNTEKEAAKNEYKYAQTNGLKIWSDTSMLTMRLRYNKTRDVSDLMLNINIIDENKKFIKNENGKPKSAQFSFSDNDIVVVAKLLPQFMTQKILGIIINHVGTETNSGLQFQLVYVDSVPNAVISIVENGNITEEYSTPLNRMYKFQYWNTDGEVVENNMNIDLVKIENMFKTALAPVVLAKNITEVCGGGSGFSNRSSGGFVRQTNTPSINKELNEQNLTATLNGIDDDADLPFDS